MLLTSPALLALPVVDIDGTLIVQGGLFLFMVIVLNGLLFKPWLEVQARRTDSIAGALDKAEQMQLDAAAKGEEYDLKLRRARDEAMELRSDLRKEGEREAADQLASARDAARESLDRAREQIGRDADQARTSLASRVDELARDIFSKILGRAA